MGVLPAKDLTLGDRVRQYRAAPSADLRNEILTLVWPALRRNAGRLARRFFTIPADDLASMCAAELVPRFDFVFAAFNGETVDDFEGFIHTFCRRRAITELTRQCRKGDDIRRTVGMPCVPEGNECRAYAVLDDGPPALDYLEEVEWLISHASLSPTEHEIVRARLDGSYDSRLRRSDNAWLRAKQKLAAAAKKKERITGELTE